MKLHTVMEVAFQDHNRKEARSILSREKIVQIAASHGAPQMLHIKVGMFI